MKTYNPFLDPSLDGKIMVDKLNGRFLTVSGTTPVGLFGNRNGRQGFYAAKPGYDVRTATDTQLAYNSDQNALKVLTTGTLVQSIPNTAGTINAGTAFNWTVNFTNTTGKIPLIIAYFQMNSSASIGVFPFFTGGVQGLPYTSASPTVNNGPLVNIFFDVLPTSITFYFNQGGTVTYTPAPIITFYYSVLQETVN